MKELNYLGRFRLRVYPWVYQYMYQYRCGGIVMQLLNFADGKPVPRFWYTPFGTGFRGSIYRPPVPEGCTG